MLNYLPLCASWIRAALTAAALVAIPAVAGEPPEENVRDELQDGDWVQVTGTVTRIKHESLTLAIGEQDFEVDTSALAYDRFDASSARPIETGDRVIVFGTMDDADPFAGRQINASTITKLPDEKEGM